MNKKKKKKIIRWDLLSPHLRHIQKAVEKPYAKAYEIKILYCIPVQINRVQNCFYFLYICISFQNHYQNVIDSIIIKKNLPSYPPQLLNTIEAKICFLILKSNLY